ncbi:MAG: hypothetical protein WC124_07455 [Desulfoplanes sp.]|nr:hypothetical protein [Desulfoplanes sp.]
MTTIQSIPNPATFCAVEGRRFWHIKGQYWWQGGKRFSILAYKAILQDSFGADARIETFSYDEKDDPCFCSRL